MGPKSLLANVTLALAALSAALLQIAIADQGLDSWAGWFEFGSALAIGAWIAWVDRRDGLCSNQTRWMIAIVLLAVLPELGELAARLCGQVGNPYEMQLARSLRNLMIGTAATRSNERVLKLSGLASLFLVLFSFLWKLSVATAILLGVYAMLGMWWLMGAYWERISGHFAESSERSVPRWPAACALALALLLASTAGLLTRSSNSTTALAGFFPSSGGTAWHDERARGGLGNGDQMVSAKENATSFGPLESELFLESQMPSLYDVFNELSEPAKPPKKKGRQRAIPLASRNMKANHKRRAKTERATREFSAVRRRPSRQQEPDDLRSHALIYVSGRVPLHLGLYSYDTWDGRSLSWQGEAAEPRMKLQDADAQGQRWVQLGHRYSRDLFSHAEQHAIRIVNLRTNRVPSPPNLARVHIDQLHTEQMFEFEGDGSLAMALDFIPQLSVLHVESQRLPRRSVPVLARVAEAGPLPKPIAETAREWTADIPFGWSQVSAICERLRTEYEHDETATVPVDCQDALEYFLFEAKRGPDYLFATSAAVMLRSLGYETRVRSGLYASPENYDRVAGQTAVTKEDTHFWAEVLLAEGSLKGEGGCWITVEPTPGYEVLHARASLLDSLRAFVAYCFDVASRHRVMLMLFGVMFGAAFWKWRLLLDQLVTAWWLLRSRTNDSRRLVSATVRLLERRARIRGTPRPRDTTISRWELFVEPQRAGGLRRDFVEAVLWALYGEGLPAVLSQERVTEICRETVRLAFRPAGGAFPNEHEGELNQS